jgi:hypothetical protein
MRMASEGVTIPVALQAGRERRLAERFGAAMPVTVDGHEGTTQDLSTSGLSFVADRPYELGARVEVVIEYLLDGHQYPLRCEAEVVRSDAAEGGRYKVGARLMPQSQLEEVPVGTAEPGESGTPRQHLRPVD